jgi:hypothetical protein
MITGSLRWATAVIFQLLAVPGSGPGSGTTTTWVGASPGGRWHHRHLYRADPGDSGTNATSSGRR